MVGLGKKTLELQWLVLGVILGSQQARPESYNQKSGLGAENSFLKS